MQIYQRVISACGYYEPDGCEEPNILVVKRGPEYFESVFITLTPPVIPQGEE